jgi:prepilin signal peptidase PulO-like enzyme (type II secretory pathway)
MYIVIFLIGLTAAIIMNMVMDFNKWPYTDKVKWFLGYTYKKLQYMIIILLIPLVFLLIYYRAQTNLEVVRYCILFLFLTATSIKDVKERKIPNSLIIGGIVMGLIVSALSFDFGRVIGSVIAFIVSGIVLLLISFITKGELGMGDVKLVAVCSIYAGLFHIIPVVLYSLILTAVTGVVFLIFQKANIKTQIPFAPFLAIGFVINLLLM